MNVTQNTYTGFTAETAKRLLLDAGAFYKNFIVGVDTPETAIHKLLGATRGGGAFSAIPTFTPIEVDGMPSGARGMDRLTSWAVSLTGNLLEAKPDTFKMALGAAIIDDATNPKYTIIRGRNFVHDSDYFDNITWVGSLSGSNDPVIIQVLNAFSTAGLTFTPVDEDQAVFQVALQGRSDRNCAGLIGGAPFIIYYPKQIFLPAPCANPFFDDETKITGRGAVGATITVRNEDAKAPVGTGEADNIGTGEADNRGMFEITVAKQKVGAVLLINQKVKEETSDDFRLTVMPSDYRPPAEDDGMATPAIAPAIAPAMATTTTSKNAKEKAADEL